MDELRISSTAATPPAVAPASRPVGGTRSTGFSDTLAQVLGQVNDLQLEAGAAGTRLAAGRTEDLAQAVVAIEKADIAFQFAMQIRNKLLEAYQEIMRMPV
jgi:flagellar hook-basal body complex protein FliE